MGSVNARRHTNSATDTKGDSIRIPGEQEVLSVRLNPSYRLVDLGFVVYFFKVIVNQIIYFSA